MIHICSLSTLEDTVARTGASHVLTVINADTNVPTPEGITAGNHLFIGMHDIAESMDGFTAPDLRHVEEIIAFAHAWPRDKPLVVHCFAGISRSTASAYAMVCALHPEMSELELAKRLRAASPSATPNRRIVALADGLLGREGRMVRAIETIGRGESAFEGTPFSLWPIA